jgi:hypothetical protein
MVKMSGTNEKKYVLYLHISPSGKKYFGITSQKPEARWSNGKGYKKHPYFWRAINKYGWDNIIHVILADDLTKNEACLFEQYFIAFYDTTNRENGYNSSTGGEGGNSGCERTEEWRRKISESHKGKLGPMYGRTGESCPMYGRTGSKSPTSKTIICLTTKQVFYGVREAERITGVSFQSISQACLGKQKSAGKLPDGTKLKWKYIKDLPKPQVPEEIKQLLRNGPKPLKIVC